MNNDLREQIAYKLIKIHKLGRVGADFDDKEANELITLIRTATLKWIPVSERLPDFDLMVLVSCKIYGRYLSSYTEVGDSGFGQWSDHEWNKGALPPTHWMPLPNPPIDNLRGNDEHS